MTSSKTSYTITNIKKIVLNGKKGRLFHVYKSRLHHDVFLGVYFAPVEIPKKYWLSFIEN